MARFLLLIAFFAAWLPGLLPAAPGKIKKFSGSLYVRNKPYAKPLIVFSGSIYARADEIVQSTGLKWRESKDSTLLYHGRKWVSLPFLARALGYWFSYNPETGIADLYLPFGVKASPSEENREKGSEPRSPAPGDPVVVVDLKQSVERASENLDVTFGIRNVTDKDVSVVRAIVHFLDGRVTLDWEGKPGG